MKCPLIINLSDSIYCFIGKKQNNVECLALVQNSGRVGSDNVAKNSKKLVLGVQPEPAALMSFGTGQLMNFGTGLGGAGGGCVVNICDM